MPDRRRKPVKIERFDPLPGSKPDMLLNYWQRITVTDARGRVVRIMESGKKPRRSG